MRPLFRKMMVVGMAVMMGVSAGAAGAQAKTITVKKCEFTTSLPKVKKLAKSVGKGTVTLVLTAEKKKYACSGYVKFKAPKTKTYKFTFSSFKGLGTGKGEKFTGFNYIMLNMSDKYIGQEQVTTQGGKTTALWTSSTNREINTKTELLDRTLHSRYGKIRLKKGQTAYIYMYHSCPKVSLKLNIK